MMRRHKVLCLQPIHPDGMRLLEARPDLDVIVAASTDPAAWDNLLPEADALVVRMPEVRRAAIEKATRLSIISRHGVGCDNIDVEAATERGILVTTVGLANAPSVVEHTIAMMFALAKRLDEFGRAVRTGDYMIKNKLGAIDVAGKTIVVVGLGRIGSRLVPVLRALGLDVIGIDPAYTPGQIAAMGAEPANRLDIVLPRADFLTLHCPLDATTRGMVGARELALMKPTAYVINCARGGIVEEAALLAALNAGRIKGAALDVTTIEPPPLDHPLLHHDRVLLTPHSAATTDRGLVRMAVTVAQNVLDHFDGRLPPSHIFNPAALANRRSTP
jgi:D-3-phosphoglycerate dehydrogenase / 2-oxoglutarate reductase